MATTALVTEILIVGLEAETWVIMLVLAAFGTEWIDLDAVDGWEALVTVLVLAGAYVLGIVVDRVADSTFGWLRGPDRPGFARKRLEVLHTSPGMAPFLEYQRSRLRVARGTLFNMIAAAVSGRFQKGTSSRARRLQRPRRGRRAKKPASLGRPPTSPSRTTSIRAAPTGRGNGR
jgi:hypothetical protein